MTLFLATVPVLLLFALFVLDMYVFRSQWKDESEESAQAVPGSPKAPAKARHQRAVL